MTRSTETGLPTVPGAGPLVAIFHRLNGSLRARLVIPLAVIATLTMAGMVLAAVELHSVDMRRAYQERALLFSALANEAVMVHVSTYQHGDLSGLLSALKQHRPDIDAISVVTSEGLISSSSTPALVGATPWPPERLGTTDTVTADVADGYAVLRPMLNDNRCSGCHGATSKVNGWLELRFSNESLSAAKRRLAGTLVLAALPSLLLLLGIAWFLLGREAVHPIQALVDAMKRAEAGHAGALAENGRPDEIGLAARGFDSTLAALRNSQAELEKAYEERMVRADRFAMIGQMATGLAHEIKNPLAGLSGALELLAEDLSESPRQSEVVTEMRHQVSRLTQIMEGLLSFARPPKARLQTTNVNSALEKVIFLVAQQRQVGEVRVTQDLDPQLPCAHADPSQLEQVFLNICLNAFQAVQASGGAIAVRSYQRDGEVLVDFADSGAGIPEEIRPNIFTPFFTTRTNGTGLGLAICSRIVSEHGGKIWFQCPPEGGTTFTVSLPAEAPKVN